MNILIAFVLLFVYFSLIGAQNFDKATGTVDVIEKGYPAATKLKPGDRLVSVDGKTGVPAKLSADIAKHKCAGPPEDGCRATTAATVVVERDGKMLTLKMRPVYDPANERTRLGFSYLQDGPRETLSAGDSITQSADRLWFITRETAKLPARLIDPEKRKEISGIVGSYETTRQAILDDIADVVGILAIISLSLAIVNLFPFLPLDGGHIFWAIVEKVRRRPVPLAVMERAGVVGFMLVILIFLIGLSNDIDRLSGEGFRVR
jgi:regulator of sigma E protease